MKINIINHKNKINSDPIKYANSVSVKELITILKYASDCYYNKNHEFISDHVFDILKEVLDERDPHNKFLKEIGSPISVSKDKVNLPYSMPSLDKVKPTSDKIDSYITKYIGPFVLSDKLDGASGLYIKTFNQEKLYSRGNGEVGQDISHLIPYVIKNVNIKVKKGETLAIRGELIITKKKFDTIKDVFKNARNAVAGLINSKNFSIQLAQITDFVAYNVISPQLSQSDQMKYLSQLNFCHVNNKIFKKISNDILSQYLIERKQNSEYEIDGIVVVNSSSVYENINKNPDHAFSFKQILDCQIAIITVKNVEWNVSKHGYLKPRINFDPVRIGGVDIEYATAFNAKFVIDNNIGSGSKIKLVRSGDVIPNINTILSQSTSGIPQMPEIPFKWNNTGVDIIVKDIHGVASDNIKIKKITDFFKIMKVKHVSHGIITKLLENKYDTLLKILTANQSDLFNIDGLGKTIINKIYTNIADSFKNSTLEQLMAASNLFGRGFGVRKLAIIVTNYPDIMKTNWDYNTIKEHVIKLDGFDDILTEQFSLNFHTFKEFFNSLNILAKHRLNNIIDLTHLNQINKITKIKKNLTFDKKIVFTGFRDTDLENLITSRGGTISTCVSNNTDYVVYSDLNNKSSKLDKAKKLGITIIEKNDFIKKFAFDKLE
jgi:NAD-dependent DNA ligase